MWSNCLNQIIQQRPFNHYHTVFIQVNTQSTIGPKCCTVSTRAECSFLRGENGPAAWWISLIRAGISDCIHLGKYSKYNWPWVLYRQHLGWVLVFDERKRPCCPMNKSHQGQGFFFIKRKNLLTTLLSPLGLGKGSLVPYWAFPSPLRLGRVW